MTTDSRMPFVRYRPMDRKQSERTLVTLHAHVDETAFATAWAAGCAMSLEQAVAYGLADSE